MSWKYKEATLQFHKELNRLFPGIPELTACALHLIDRRFDADRLTSFHLDSQEMLLRSEFCLNGGVQQEIEEEIYIMESSPLMELSRGKRDFLSYTSPHPILFVRMGAGGVLRLERLKLRRPFSAIDKKFAPEWAKELAERLQQAQWGERNRRQLQRAQALTELTALFAASLRVEDGLKLILRGIQKYFLLDRVRLYLIDRSAKTLKGELSADMTGLVQSLRIKEAPLEPRAHRFVDLLLNGRQDPWVEHYQQTVLHIPLTVQGSVIGLLVMDNLISQDTIEEEDAALLKSFSGQIALAVDNSRLFEEVQALSLYDDLTGMPLRRYFLQRFQEELYRAERSNQPVSVGLIDIDYFKSVNDTYGHQIGDQVLKEVGRRVLAELRKMDFSCRYGGDEILILLPQAGAAEACRIMERLAQRLKEIRIPAPFSRAQEVRITVSIGVSSSPTDGRTMEELIGKADEALYGVKAKGRDGVAPYAQTRSPQIEAAPKSEPMTV